MTIDASLLSRRELAARNCLELHSLNAFQPIPKQQMKLGSRNPGKFLFQISVLKNSFLGIPYRISDPHSEGGTDLQNLITCLNHEEL